MMISVARVLPALVGIWMTTERPANTPASAIRCCAGQSSTGKWVLASAGRQRTGSRPDAAGKMVRAAFLSFSAHKAPAMSA